MKKIATILALSAMVLVLGGMAIAEGAQEDRAPYGTFSTEKMTLTGAIDFTAAHTILKTDSGEWELMYPRMWAEEVDVQDGQTITVSGYEVPGPRWNTGDDEQYLHVVSAEIDGKTYDLSEAYGPMMGDGYGRGYGRGHGGMMGGYGHGYDRGGMMGGGYGSPQGGRSWR